VELACLDEDILKNQIIGQETYRIADLLGGTSFPIKFKGKLAGEVTLQCSLVEMPTGSLSPNSLLKKFGEGI